MNELFNSIWRDQFLRSKIRNQRFNHRTIGVSLSYLERNSKYLALLDTKTHDIYIQFSTETELSKYLAHPLNAMFNSVRLQLKSTECLEGVKFPSSVRQFSITFLSGQLDLAMLSLCTNITDLTMCFRNVSTTYRGDLPAGLKRLDIKGVESEQHKPEIGPLPESLTSLTVSNYKLCLPESLPPSLTLLKLSWEIIEDASQKIIVPASLTDLNVQEEEMYIIKNRFTVPKGKLFSSARVKLLTEEDVEQLNQCPWVTNVTIYNNSLLKLLPSTIKSIYFFGGQDKDAGFTAGSLPPLLHRLSANQVDYPIVQGFLPSTENTLTILELPQYNHVIPSGLLPASLTKLDISSYNHPITQVGVIPSNIKYLSIKDVAKISANVLPSSIIELNIYPDKLMISNNVLPHSLLTFRAYFKRISSKILVFGQSVTLPKSIINLSLFSDSDSKSQSIKSNLIPPNVRNLELSNIIIKKGMIPPSCFYLSTNYHPIKEGLIPKNVKQLFITHYEKIDFIPPTVELLKLNNPLESYPFSDLTVKRNGVLYSSNKVK
ncbi:hypothetical protein CYY_001066 [Polysphondylium violaceum]|uniref:FNIP repeat-containing protein n=1 Tax=Polysphondylium violaceum TaxID=133409 RepID=A0A8J4Q0D8_9MYCE|nr:hypothetical protein CYY_001066 [Polysphondylium violaceum]